jgi:hypothetical protein
MTLSFPNQARSYDEDKRRVRFLGHDGMFEIRFFVPADLLGGELPQRTANPSDYLASFDALRPKIQKAAEQAYKANRNSTITLNVQKL